MVTKRKRLVDMTVVGSVLAKILMVTKPKYEPVKLSGKFCSSKNPYGNKTNKSYIRIGKQFCSSKNPYGNKT